MIVSPILMFSRVFFLRLPAVPKTINSVLASFMFDLIFLHPCFDLAYVIFYILFYVLVVWTETVDHGMVISIT